MRRAALWVIVCFAAACSGGDGAAPTQEAGADEPVDDGGGDAELDAGEDGSTEDGGEAPEAGAGLCASCGGCEEQRTVNSAQHKPEPISYADNPPTGGDHASCWSTFGVHGEAVPESRWVHNLEHGAIVFLYNCPDGCAAEVKQLEALAKGRPFALVTPDARLPTRFAAVAWGIRLLSECLDGDAFIEFYDKHVDQAGESTTSPPPGGC
jgi:hypothetical protein